MNATRTPPTQAEIPRILVVDDSPTVLGFVERTLAEEGFDVRTVDNVFVSAQVLDFRPHVVLMDVHLGVSLGTIAVRALKRCGFASETRFVLYSSTGEQELAQHARDCDADEWFRKTESPEHLKAKVRAILAGHSSPLRLDPAPSAAG